MNSDEIKAAFERINERDTYRLKFAHFPYLYDALAEERGRAGRGTRILDVGCGPGNAAAFCGARPDWVWFGFDLWEHQLRQAREKAPYEAVIQGNLVEGAPFRDESFDVVICIEVLMYLPNSPELLADFRRILRPAGALYVYNPISWFPKTMSALRGMFRTIHQEQGTVALDRQTEWRSAKRACRINYYSPSSLVEEIGRAGFRVRRVAGFRLFRNRLRFMNKLERRPWYRESVAALAAKFPHAASDLLVRATKSPDNSAQSPEEFQE